MINVTAAAVAQEVKKRKLLMDGAFGTYYGQLYDTAELPELADISKCRCSKECVGYGMQKYIRIRMSQ